MIRWAITLLAAASTSLAAQEREPFGFKGFPLGGSKADFEAKFPEYRCREASCRINLKMDCAAPRGAECFERNTYGGVIPNFVFAFFTEAGLQHVMVGIASRQYDSIFLALTDRYGKPTSASSSKVRTKAGVEYTNEQATWTRPAEEISISRYGSSVDSGYVVIETAVHRDLQAEIARKRREDAKKDL